MDATQPRGRKNARLPRGTAPLALSFGDAVDLASKIYDASGNSISLSLLSTVMQNSTSSSAFVRKISSLKAFGLVADGPQDTLTLTDVGLSVVSPLSAESGALAKRDAFLRVEPFSKIYQRHKGKLLPADEFLRNIIEQECGIPKQYVKEWLDAFKEGARSANLFFDRGDGKIQVTEPHSKNPSQANAPSATAEPIHPTAARTNSESQHQPNVQQQSEAGHITRLTLSTGTACISFPENITASDAKRLKGALNGCLSIIESMVTDPAIDQP